ncbi:Multidrug resistance protein NorM [Stieleria varia]|uniref:Multidrug-efflux transporter n=2 Tax=Stieleria varia TaxID=2528005 RepID=A0A5C6A840_9BACT|nr:Multidrug resistance protein NorM [Stieleria varia]
MLELIRVAMPLMVSTGTFCLVLFTDRTLLLRFDGPSMSASMAGGNLFWVLICVPMGVISMSGAIIGQHVGAGEDDKVGRLIWQSVWMALLTIPFFSAVALYADLPFRWTNQPEELIALESAYLGWLMIGAVGLMLETALSGFFAGTERTRVIMWVSVFSGILNIILDAVLIFGLGPIPAMGIVGAAIGSVVAFWFKAACYAVLLCRPAIQSRYEILSGFGFDRAVFLNLLFYGLPSGLMNLAEAGGFTVIILRIGNLGDLPLRATAMAINFNMIAFIPLVGVGIATSVLVGRHLLESGPKRATMSAVAAFLFALTYSVFWAIAYIALPDKMMSLYTYGEMDQSTLDSTHIAQGLLGFVAMYLILDSSQLIFASALRGAGDTWFVLLAGLTASIVALTIGYQFEPTRLPEQPDSAYLDTSLQWWWWIITMWIWMLGIAMTGRFIQGRWKEKRMV